MTFLKPPGLLVDTSLVKYNGRVKRDVKFSQVTSTRKESALTSAIKFADDQSSESTELQYSRLLCAANLYRRKKNFPKAIETFRTLLQLKPGTLSLSIYLGKALEQVNEHAEAYKVYKEAVFANPTSLQAHDLLISFCNARGRYIEACEHLDRALAIQDNLQLRMIQCRVLFELKKFQEVINVATKVFVRYPGRYIALQLLYVESILEVKQFSGEPTTDTRMIKVLNNLSIQLQDIISLAPKNMRARLIHSRVLVGLSRYSDALTLLEDSLDIDPQNEDIQNALVDVLDLIDWSEDHEASSS